MNEDNGNITIHSPKGVSYDYKAISKEAKPGTGLYILKNYPQGRNTSVYISSTGFRSIETPANKPTPSSPEELISIIKKQDDIGLFWNWQ